MRDLGAGFEPGGKEFELKDANLSLLHAKPEMFQQRPGDPRDDES